MTEGLPHVSYDNVAQASGLTRQLVRYYFPDPDDLMLAMCEKIATVYREALIQGMIGRDEDDRVNFFLDFFFDILESPRKPRDDQVYDALMSLSARSDRIKTNLRDQYSLLGQVISHELRQQYETIPLPVCEQISFVFISMMYGHWKMVASLGLSEEHKFITRQAMDRLLESYRLDSQPAPCTGTWKSNE